MQVIIILIIIIIIFIDEYKEQKYKIHQYRFKKLNNKTHASFLI